MEVEGFIFSATNSLDELATKDVNGVLVPTTQKEAIQKVRQLYYKAAVVDPYILLNYGTTNLEELYQAEIEPQEFLAKEASSEELSDIETKVTTAAGEDRGKRRLIVSIFNQLKLFIKQSLVLWCHCLI